MYLVDGHVHFQPGFSLNAFLDAASRNFQAAARRAGVEAGTPGLLALTETREAGFFDDCASGRLSADSNGWSFRASDENVSLLAYRGGEPALILIAGRQVRSAERLEVLALATRRTFEDGHPFDQSLQAVLDSDALPVLPWGFGKWWGHRGAIIQSLLDSPIADRVLLAENGGRLRFGQPPRLLREARQRSVPVLAGSDPLAIPWQCERVGSSGFIVDAPLDLDRPAQHLREALGARQQPRLFGVGVSLQAFLRAQVGIRLRKL